MAAHQLADRHADGRVPLQRVGEVRRLADLQPHPQPQRDEQRRKNEGNAPAPGREFGIAQRQAQDQEQAVRGDEAHGRAKLRKHAEARAPARRRILDRQQRRAAPFAAQAEPLPETQDAQQQRRHPPDHRIGRQKGDQQRGGAHQHQRGDQRRFAPDAIAIMAKDDRADRPREKGETKAHEAEHQLRRGRFGRKEQGTEHQRRRRAIDIEIIEFDRRADQAGGEDAAMLAIWCQIHGRRPSPLRPVAALDAMDKVTQGGR